MHHRRLKGHASASDDRVESSWGYSLAPWHCLWTVENTRHPTYDFFFQIVYVYWKSGRHLPSCGKLRGSHRYTTTATHNKLAHSPEPGRENNSFRSKDLGRAHQRSDPKNGDKKGPVLQPQASTAQGSRRLGYQLHTAVYCKLPTDQGM